MTAFLSAMSAENATSALIVSLGSRPSKKHHNSIVLYRLFGAAKEPLRSKLVTLVESMKMLEPHITKARYPIRKGTGLIPPVKFYSKNIAKELFKAASKVMDLVKVLIVKVEQKNQL